MCEALRHPTWAKSSGTGLRPTASNTDMVIGAMSSMVVTLSSHAEMKAVMQQSSTVTTRRLPRLTRRQAAQMTSNRPVFCNCEKRAEGRG